ncbi:MAG: hypothetical protein JWP37_4001 [Mucilaginibacter sp.]|nr:hypothetical protein [Mucilaginibacter sp.]
MKQGISRIVIASDSVAIANFAYRLCMVRDCFVPRNDMVGVVMVKFVSLHFTCFKNLKLKCMKYVKQEYLIYPL